MTSSGSISQGAINQWRRKRIDRMVVEYFLRNGYYNAAITLAEKSDIKDLTNIGEWEIKKRTINKKIIFIF